MIRPSGYGPARFRPTKKGIVFLVGRCRSRCGRCPQPGETGLEIGLEVRYVLEADLQAQAGTARIENGGRAVSLAVEGHDQAFEASPGKAHAEQLQPVE